MTETSPDKEPLVGRVVGKVTPLQGLDALRQVVETARECFIIHEEEATKRARLDAYEKTEVARIKAGESVLRDYFAQAFGVRRHMVDGLFTRLDDAMEKGDGNAVHEVLRGIVDVARTSPLADLGDLGQIRAALDDPDQVWEL
jgi:hypothetical protein